jgi:HEAT repeat protein
LARLAAVEHRRLAEGYRAQEKDARARLALDWALYRMGKGESLFQLVGALDEKKQAEQAVAYLKQLEGPEPLYVFLERVNDDTKIPLLEVLARLGDEKTLERINPYASSYDPRIANAAQFAIREITRRQSQHEQLMRPRQTGKSAETEQEEDQTEP